MRGFFTRKTKKLLVFEKQISPCFFAWNCAGCAIHMLHLSVLAVLALLVAICKLKLAVRKKSCIWKCWRNWPLADEASWENNLSIVSSSSIAPNHLTNSKFNRLGSYRKASVCPYQKLSVSLKFASLTRPAPIRSSLPFSRKTFCRKTFGRVKKKLIDWV